MSADLIALLAENGTLALFLLLAINCLGVPFPASLMMLAAGSFAAQGEMDLTTVLAVGTAGAVLGDQTGYAVGRLGGAYFVNDFARRFGATTALARAEALSKRWGGAGVFLSRWLFSPLGPYVNLVSGMTRLSWTRFTVWGVAGEVIWVGGYVGLGFTFSGSVQVLADVLGNLSWFLAGAIVTLLLGWKAVPLIRGALWAHGSDGGKRRPG